MEYAGAQGWLVGEAHRGIAAMFTMMNNARLGVGVHGVSQAEGALQAAMAFAAERRQGVPPGGEGPIAGHPDVRRMLGTMQALTHASRAICLDCALAIDMGTATGEEAWAARAGVLTPIAKAFGTDTGMRVAELAVQVHGGMGYIEETGVAQFYRDVRVTAIYEGTNGIQAMDLVGRKLADGGVAARRLIAEAAATAAEAGARGAPLAAAAAELGAATEWMAGAGMGDRFAGAAPYLRAFALVLGGHYLLRGALADPGRGALAEFYLRQVLAEAGGLLAQAREGAGALDALALG
jgi:hypothetical protein